MRRHSSDHGIPVSRYLTLFMNLLNDTESQGEKEVSEQGYQTEESTALRNATIQAMSNLLGANIDSGLSYSLRESDVAAAGTSNEAIHWVAGNYVFKMTKFGS